MELLYENDYGVTYKLLHSPNPSCDIQLVIDTVGLFMSRSDLDHLLKIVLKSHGSSCACPECDGDCCNRIWCANPLMDINLKVNERILFLLEDLIRGTQFILDMDATLKENRVKPGN
ncbi:hypothetical protein [Ulvibacterium sp.]|uniref:hypothetical protein n=1 Tax=Ulvibacterium sp. TaxID=2665914 RepID=UPI002603CC99|nr:hypothetical protein [Ulvibacterium sp.]